MRPGETPFPLADLPEWRREGEGWRRVWYFSDLFEAMRFVRRVADLAMECNLAPRIEVLGGKVTIEVGVEGGMPTGRDAAFAHRVEGRRDPRVPE